MAKTTGNYLNNTYMPRSITNEIDFSMGMNFVNSAVSDKFVRALVNFDIKEKGAALTPRRGLRVKEICLPTPEFIRPDTSLYSKTNLRVLDSRNCVRDNKHYKQFILGQPNEVWVATTVADEDNTAGRNEILTLTEVKYDPAPTASEVGQSANFVIPHKAAIHDLILDDSNLISNIVGTFGFNDNYYFMTSEGLKYTEFDTDRYKIKDITAKSMSAAEAPLSGYNMLSETPYLFENLIEDNSEVNLMGLMPYDADGKLLLKPKQNQSVVFRCYLAAATNTNYKFIWESKQVGEVSWITRKIKTNVILDGTEADDEALTCEFIPPERNTLIRVQVFKRNIMPVDANHAVNPIMLFTVADSDPVSGMESGDKYFNTADGKIYSYTGSAWDKTSSTIPAADIDQYYFNESNANYYRCMYAGTLSMLLLDEERYDNVCDQQITVGFDFSPKVYGDKLTADDANYDLTTATGMVQWSSRLGVYGLPKDPTLLFISDFEDPTYFPYPNNLVMFDEPIVQVKQYLDDLVVLTEGGLYAVNSPDGVSWNKTTIQKNLAINYWDRHLVEVVRNMVYFKSGNYYFMIVPKAQSMTGELTLAPISNPIKDFLDNFSQSVDELFQATYGRPFNLQSDEPDGKLVNYYNFLDFEDVHNVYVFYRDQEGENDSYVHVDLLYNTVTRAWKTYIYEAPFCLVPHQHDATQPGKLCASSQLNIVMGRNTEYHLDDPLEFTPINEGSRLVLAHRTVAGTYRPLYDLVRAASLNALGNPASFDSFRIAFYNTPDQYINTFTFGDFYYDFLATDVELLGSNADARLEVVSVDGKVKLTQYLDSSRVSTEALILETTDAETYLIPYVTDGNWRPFFHDSAAAEGVYSPQFPQLENKFNTGIGNCNCTPTKNTIFRGHLQGDPGEESVVVSGTTEYILPCDEISIVPVGDEYLITISGEIDPTEYFAINTGKRVRSRVIQILAGDPANCSDFYIPYLSDYIQYGVNFAEMVSNTTGRIQEFTELSDDFVHYKNYQFLDSGYRDINLGTNKRYRELQLSLNKIDNANFDFGIDFLLDGENRPQSYEFVVDQYGDPETPGQGLMYLTLASLADFGKQEYTQGTNRVMGKIWSILQTKFQDITMWKLRINLSGKGNAPRFRFVSKNEFKFELTKYAWVYRIKNAR